MKNAICLIPLLFLSCSLSFKSEGNLLYKSEHEHQRKNTVSILVGASASMNNEKVDFTGVYPDYNTSISLDIWKDEVNRAFDDSRIFSRVEPGFEKSELKACVRVHLNIKRSIAMQIISALTLFIIPYWDRDNVTVIMVIEDMNGKCIASSEKSCKITTVYNVLFVAASIFQIQSLFTSYDAAIYSLSRTCLNDIENQLYKEESMGTQ
jgi:hypothetical protein